MIPRQTQEDRPGAWVTALKGYCWHVDLRRYPDTDKFPEHFKYEIEGDRDSTIAFENRFREQASYSIEAYFEVVFWKLYSHPSTALAINQGIKNQPGSLNAIVTRFVDQPTIENLRSIRRLLGLQVDDGPLAVALTFPAFLNPEMFPMVDTYVAEWVNRNLPVHGTRKLSKLTVFPSRCGKVKTTLSDLDFESYRSWVDWCRETAQILTERTSVSWRARDVEMAIFTAERSKGRIELEVL